MTGVRISKNVDPEIRAELGFDVIAHISFFLGVPYPLPDWYQHLSKFRKNLWIIYCRFGDVMMTLLFISNFIELFSAYKDIRAFVTCTGTVTYIVCFRIKMQIYKNQTKNLEKLIGSLHKITENLNMNPVDDKKFFKIYRKFFKHVVFFGKGKVAAISGGVCVLAVYEMIHGYFQESHLNRNLPMFGWYPYDLYSLFAFEFSCFFQLVSYQSFLLKDVAVDLFFLTILVILNTQLIYLRELLRRIVGVNEKRFGLAIPDDKTLTLRWWVRHHQMVLRTIDDFKEVTNPYLFSKYISVGIILFFGGVLVTSKIEYDGVQQVIVLAINSSNLLQLYIFSIMGDEITENGLKLTENGLHVDIITNSQSVRKSYLYIVTRCTKPVLIHFGQINPLCVASFGQIVKITFSYFITIVQIRDKALENNNLFFNSTV